MKTPTTSPSPSRKNYTPRLLAIALLTGLLLATLARGQTNAPAVNAAGVYQLISVDGKIVPCAIDHEGTAMHIQAGAFTITTNGQCLSRMVVSVGDRTNLTVNTRATYVLQGTGLTMTWQGAGMTQGVLSGSTFTMTNEDMAYVYRK